MPVVGRRTSSGPVPGALSAEQLVSAVRVHADRVHDAVRRQGCAPEAAAQVVRTSAVELVRRVGGGRAEVDTLVGWWFARARALGLQAERDEGALPMGGSGPLAKDSVQQLLAGAIELRPERQRTAVLLRDAYDLPPEVVAAALGTDADAAMRLVGASRMALLPDVYDTTVPSLAGHAVDEAALARLSEGRQVQARDATTRKHAQSCGLCRPAVEAQDDARRLLAGLSVVALPAAHRAALMAAVEDQAYATLPTAADLAAAAEQEVIVEEIPRRLFSPLLTLLALIAAVGLGAGVGVASSGRSVEPVSIAPLPTVTAPVPPTPEPQAPAPARPPDPVTSVFTISPAPSTTRPSTRPSTTQPPRTAPPTTPPSPSPDLSVGPARIDLGPSSGPSGTQVQVSGTGWTAGQRVTVAYLDPDGEPTASRATVVPAEDGTFQVGLTLRDPDGAGPHAVRATNGDQTQSAPFTQT